MSEKGKKVDDGNGAVFMRVLVRCHCGIVWWALQPAKGGPLVIFRWPGDWMSGPLADKQRRAA